MDDMTAVMREVNARLGNAEISDGCARTIASWYHNGQASSGYSFVSTGTIPASPSDLWRDLTDNGKAYENADDSDKRALDMLGTYLTSKGSRGPVAGWADKWVSKHDPDGTLEGTPLDEIPHADYPHEAGRLYDCARCESECFCTGRPDDTECVFCASL